MRDAVIVEAVRTPTGKRNGGLAGIHSADLSAHVLRALAERTGIDPAVVDDVIWGCVMQIGEQTFDIARTAVLSAGWPESVPGTTVDRQCGSSQQAVHFAAAGVISGQYDVAVAGGVEVMSRTPMGEQLHRQPARRGLRRPLRQRLPEPGHRRRGHRRHLGLQPRAARRVRPALPRAGALGQRGRRVRRADRPGDQPRRRRHQHGRGHPPRRHDGEARLAQAGLQGGRQDHGGQLLADLRRLGRAAHHDQREGQVARPHPDRALPHRRPRRRRPDADAARPDARDPQGVRRRAACPRATSARTR